MSFGSLLINTLDIITASGTTEEGNPNFVTVATGVRSRVEFGNQQLINVDGEQIVGNFLAFIDPPQGFNVNAGDQILFDNNHYTLIEIRKEQDSSGVHHYELRGKTSRIQS